MKANSKLGNFNKFLAVLLVLAIIFLVLVVTVIKPGGAYEAAPVDANAAGDADVATIDELVPGTYGGIEFNTIDDVVNYYVQCYNYTKTLTAQYNDNGTTATYYKLLGMEDLTIENLLVEGKSNDVVNKLVPSILGSVFTGGLKGLPPCGNISPTADQVGDGIDVTKSLLTAEDVLAANVGITETAPLISRSSRRALCFPCPVLTRRVISSTPSAIFLQRLSLSACFPSLPARSMIILL